MKKLMFSLSLLLTGLSFGQLSNPQYAQMNTSDIDTIYEIFKTPNGHYLCSGFTERDPILLGNSNSSVPERYFYLQGIDPLTKAETFLKTYDFDGVSDNLASSGYDNNGNFYFTSVFSSGTYNFMSTTYTNSGNGRFYFKFDQFGDMVACTLLPDKYITAFDSGSWHSYLYNGQTNGNHFTYTGYREIHNFSVSQAGISYIPIHVDAGVDLDPNSSAGIVNNDGLIIVKLDADGEYLDHIEFSKQMIVSSLEVKPNGELLIAGYSKDEDLDPSSSNTVALAEGGFILSMDQNMNYQWSHEINTPFVKFMTSATLTNGNNVIIGNFYENATFDPNGQPQTLSTSASYRYNYFVLTLDPNGLIIRLDQIRTSSGSDFQGAIHAKSFIEVLPGGFILGLSNLYADINLDFNNNAAPTEDMSSLALYDNNLNYMEHMTSGNSDPNSGPYNYTQKWGVCVSGTELLSYGSYYDEILTTYNGTETRFSNPGISGSYILATSSGSLGLDRFDLSEGVKIFPNPTKNTVNVEFESNTFTSIEVRDLQGRMMSTSTIDLHQQAKQIDFESFAKGTYLVQLISGDQTIIKKVIKE